jgi:hypothetical protein
MNDKIINIQREPLLYFLLDENIKNPNKVYKKDIVYGGETKSELGKEPISKTNMEKHTSVRKISSTVFKFLNNEYFRKYYERRWINFFNPYYNQEKYKLPSLNLFLLKMFLHFENPNPFFINPLTNHCEFMREKNSEGLYWLEHRPPLANKSKWVINGYTRVWETVDLNKKLYIDNQDAFKFLISEEMKTPLRNGKLRKVFTPRKERLHN